MGRTTMTMTTTRRRDCDPHLVSTRSLPITHRRVVTSIETSCSQSQLWAATAVGWFWSSLTDHHRALGLGPCGCDGLLVLHVPSVEFGDDTGVHDLFDGGEAPGASPSDLFEFVLAVPEGVAGGPLPVPGRDFPP